MQLVAGTVELVALPPGWYVDVMNPARFRWFDGTAWTDHFSTNGGYQARRPVPFDFASWTHRATHVLNSVGVLTGQWDALIQELHHRGIPTEDGLRRINGYALPYLHQVVTFAFADGIIEQHEVDQFDRAVRNLGMVGDRKVDELRQRLMRGLALSKLEAGDLPRLQNNGLHIDPTEILHFDQQTVYCRFTPSGQVRQVAGRLAGTNAKLRLVALQGGFELAWAKVLDVRPERGCVYVATTAARGGGVFRVADAEYSAAVLSGVMKVAKRMVIRPGQRDTRSIPHHIRTEVWQRYGGKCADCGAREYLEFDHMIPHSRGGATSLENLQLLCRACNQAKGNRI